MIIINENQLKALNKFKSLEPTRYAMNLGCLLPDGRLAATDGRKLIIITPPKEEQRPTKSGKNRLFDLKATDLKIKGTPKLKGIPREVEIEFSDNWGVFPDVDAVIPNTSKAKHTIKLSAERLKEICEAHIALHGKNNAAITFNFMGDKSPVVLKSSSPLGGEMLSLLGPMGVKS